MNEEILSEIRNKLTAPKIALEKLAQGEKMPKEFLELALKEFKMVIDLLMRGACPGSNTDRKQMVI